MKARKLILSVVLLFLILISISSASVSVEADERTSSVETDEKIFTITDFSGRIGEESFDSVAEFERLINEPIIAGTQIEINCSIELVSPPPRFVHFLRLYSGLPESRWDATPARLKDVQVWADHGPETHLWVPPTHDVLEMTVSFSGRIPHPVVEDVTRTDEGAAVRRTLVREILAEILLIEVRKTLAEFPYTTDPEAWVRSSVLDSSVVRATGIATSEMIKDARAGIEEMEKALALLEDPEGEVQERLAMMPHNAGDLFGALIIRQRNLANSLHRLLEGGYPDIVLEKAPGITGVIHGTKVVVRDIEEVEEFWRIIAQKDHDIKQLTDDIAARDQDIEGLTAELGLLQGDLDAARGRTTIFMALTGVFVVLAIVFFLWAWFEKRSKQDREEEEIE
ncbi:hypothetical protein M1N79_02385 [Dehalococcoidia bacterium]|nr:hypothetical protein [Dehalococcoidia bacterium]